MSGKWSPGPWSWTRESPWHVFDESGEFVCEIYIDTDEFTAPDESPEGLANGHLIAAAPTMADYIKRKSDEGCAEAASIWEQVNAR